MSNAFDIVESREFLSPNATGKDVYELFIASPDLLCVALVEAGRPLGLINRTTFFNRFGDQFGRALYEKRPAAMLMDAEPVIIDADAPLPNWADMPGKTTTSILLQGFIVVRDGRFEGVSSL